MPLTRKYLTDLQREFLSESRCTGCDCPVLRGRTAAGAVILEPLPVEGLAMNDVGYLDTCTLFKPHTCPELRETG